jgi:hypothetical protein
MNGQPYEKGLVENSLGNHPSVRLRKAFVIIKPSEATATILQEERNQNCLKWLKYTSSKEPLITPVPYTTCEVVSSTVNWNPQPPFLKTEERG